MQGVFGLRYQHNGPSLRASELQISGKPQVDGKDGMSLANVAPNGSS
jgi:hypothetical protein